MEVRIFLGAIQYLRKFIASLSIVATSLQVIKTNGKSFQWGKNQHKSFEELKQKIIQAPILTLTNLKKYFEVEIDVDVYVMIAMLMQGEGLLYHHSKLFLGKC